MSEAEISDEELAAIEKRWHEAQDPSTCSAASILLSATDTGRLIEALRSERERAEKVEEAFRTLSKGFQALKERSEEAQEALTPFVETIWLSSERAKAAEERAEKAEALAEHYHLHLAAIASGREEHSCAGDWSCPVCVARRALEPGPVEERVVT